MKKISLCCFLIISLLGGCAEDTTKQPETEEKITLQEYDYTEEEKELLDLLAFGYYVATYHRTPEVKCIYLNIYQLNNGEWENVGGTGNWVLDDTENLDGKLAVQLKEDNTVLLSIQNNDGATVLYEPKELEIVIEGKIRSYASLYEPQEMELNEETVIRIIALDEEERMDIELNDFYEPEKLKDLDLVLAATVTFMDQQSADKLLED